MRAPDSDKSNHRLISGFCSQTRASIHHLQKGHDASVCQHSLDLEFPLECAYWMLKPLYLITCPTNTSLLTGCRWRRTGSRCQHCHTSSHYRMMPEETSCIVFARIRHDLMPPLRNHAEPLPLRDDLTPRPKPSCVAPTKSSKTQPKSGGATQSPNMHWRCCRKRVEALVTPFLEVVAPHSNSLMREIGHRAQL
jgi:hypothetical protein